MNSTSNLTRPPASRLKECSEPSVWLEFSPLANKLQAINLGQGFPDWDPPQFVKDAYIKAVEKDGSHKYARSSGQMSLVQELSQRYSESLGIQLSCSSDVIVTNGASGAIFLSLMSFVNPGDEVVVIEPAFDLYYGAITMAGGVVRGVALKSLEDQVVDANCLTLDVEELKEALNEKTKILILNNPHNPTGKVLSCDELNAIAEVVRDYENCIVLSDEVYEHLVYDDESHVPFASLPKMFDRTISIYSASKTFSVTGWKVGWAIGPEALIRPLQISQQWSVFSVATPLQEAVSEALQRADESYQGEESYYTWLKLYYETKRDVLYSVLKEFGLAPVNAKGSFFITCNLGTLFTQEKVSFPSSLRDMIEAEPISVDQNTRTYSDYNCCRHLALDGGLVSIPMSAFYYGDTRIQQAKNNLARFAFCKSTAVLEQSRTGFEKIIE